jgi:hypothetical protein
MVDVQAKMPSTPLLYQRRSELSTESQNKASPVHLKPAEIAVVSVFSALIVGVMIFCLYRFCPGRSWRQKRKADKQKSTMDVKQTFLDLDDEKTLTEVYAPVPEVKQTFLNVDKDKARSEKKGLGIDMHPAMRPSESRPKRKHGANRNESLDSTSSVTPLIIKSDVLLASPPRSLSPRIYSPRTPPPVPGTSTEVRISSKCTRPLPTPVQLSWNSPHQPSRYDISPLQTSATLPDRSQLPMSFLIEIDAKREDQTAERSRTVSPLQNPPTPLAERLLSDSQLSSRNVSPVSAPSTTPVITYPSATPVYLPRPFSKYNPYRPPLEPAGSKNWPLENMAIPEHSAVRGPIEISPVRKHLTQSPLKPQRTISPTPTFTTTITATAAEPEKPEKEPAFTHPELDPMFLEQFHRRRRQNQKAKEEQQKQKRKAEREKARAARQQAAAAFAASALRPAKKLPIRGSKEKGIPPNRKESSEARTKSVVAKKRGLDGRERPTKVVEKKKSFERKTAEQWMKNIEQHGIPPRLPSKSRKPSQSPDAYEKARRISGLHELVGSSLLASRG